MENKKFCHLHLHNQYSQLDGMGTEVDYAERAKELGFTHIGLTNHGNIDGIIKWQKACEANGLKGVVGAEMYIVPDATARVKEKRHHINLIIKNQQGFENLTKLLTYANMEGFYYKPRIDSKSLLEHCEGLIVLTACTSTFVDMKGGRRLVAQLSKKIPGDVYFEIMPHQYERQYETNSRNVNLAEKLGCGVVATNDCHYVKDGDEETHEILITMQQKRKLADKDRWKFEIDGLYLRTADEMVKAFKEQGQFDRRIYLKAIFSSMEIAEKCEGFTIGKQEVFLPRVPGYEDEDETELMWSIIDQGYKERLVDSGIINESNQKEYEERVKEEFDLICNLKYQRYFLIVWELISWCKKNDIMTGPGRGSVGGSLVAYCMRITDVDPIEYGLVFARFISPARIDLPDIDMDFEDIKRHMIRQHLEDAYGKYNVTGISTFMSMKGRGALRDVARVYNANAIETDKAAKSIVVRSGGDFRSSFTIEDAFETFEDGINYKKKYPDVVKHAIKLEGQIKGSGKHAAAMCISADDLREGKRMYFAKRSNELICNWEKNDAEYMGMMKLDVLGLSALTILNTARRLIKENYNVDIVFDKIDLGDKATLKACNDGHTVGAFQIGTSGIQNFCKELGIDEFNDIVLATSLWRPGTLRSGMTAEFVERKHRRVEFEYQHPILEGITGETYGIILYQEQVMWLMYQLGGLGWKTCDTVRKVISKSQGDELIRNFKGQFVEGCKERNTLNEKDAGVVWDSLASFGSYGFNKAHAVEYSLITYWGMWLKIHYAKEFIAASLTYCGDDKKTDLIAEAKRLGIKVELPKIKHSHPTEWRAVGDENIIYTPFKEIKGVGDSAAKAIANMKPGGGFYKKTTKPPNKTIMSILEKIHAFDDDTITEEEEEEYNKYFTFDISSDPMRKFRKFYEQIEDQISTLKKVTSGDGSGILFGKMVSAKFGYKKNVLKKGAKGGGGMGGAYGDFKDESGIMMVNFAQDLYAKRKYEIEHCEGQWMMIKTARKKNKSTDMFFAEEMWTEEDIINGNIESAGLSLYRKEHFRRRREVQNCESCKLIEKCLSKPIPHKPGRMNLMVVNETPNRFESSSDKLMSGKFDNKLWNKLKALRISKDDVHITNVVKCQLGSMKGVNKKLVKQCGDLHLSEEIEAVKPSVILAFGNASLKFFNDQDSGIIEKSGTIEWSYEYGAWIVWSITPFSASFDESNMELLNTSISNFANLVKKTIRRRDAN
jgi:DNA polymerase III subunit alpha